MEKIAETTAVQAGIWRTYWNVLKKYFVFSGRSSRYEFSAFIVVNFIVGVLLQIAQKKSGFPAAAAIITGVYNLGILLPFWGLLTRRFHDSGIRGWWLLGLFISMVLVLVSVMMVSHPLMITRILIFIGLFIALLFFLFRKGNPETNAFGEVPVYHPNLISKVVISIAWMIFVLPLILIFLTGAISGYSKASYKYQINETAGQVAFVVQNVRRISADKHDYKEIDNAYLIKKDLVRKNMIKDCNDEGRKSGNCIRHAFDGEIIVSGNPYAKNHNVIYILNNLSKQACIGLATLDMGENSGYLGALISNKDLAVKDFAPDKTSATMNCECQKNTCAVGFVFK